MNTKIINSREAVRLLVETNPTILRDAWHPTLFGGDRLTCCDEAAIVEVNDKVVALATIAPEGEITEGQPTIVGLYTVRSHRQQGYGKLVLETAIRRCIERGFTKIHIDVLTPKAMKTIKSLSEQLQSALDVQDNTFVAGFLD